MMNHNAIKSNFVVITTLKVALTLIATKVWLDMYVMLVLSLIINGAPTICNRNFKLSFNLVYVFKVEWPLA